MWYRVKWEVDVEAKSDEEAWLSSAQVILERAQQMQDRQNPHVHWRKYGRRQPGEEPLGPEPWPEAIVVVVDKVGATPPIKKSRTRGMIKRDQSLLDEP